MKNLKKKLRKAEGFTLIEMLIVVAIIAILVAVSIPLVGTALESARAATDSANERAAKAAATLAYLGQDTSIITTGTFTPGNTYSYDAVNGTLSSSPLTKGYGTTQNQHTSNCLCTATTPDTTGHKDKYIQVSVSTAGVVTLSWVAVTP